jgi:hypothetical protein
MWRRERRTQKHFSNDVSEGVYEIRSGRKKVKPNDPERLVQLGIGLSQVDFKSEEGYIIATKLRDIGIWPNGVLSGEIPITKRMIKQASVILTGGKKPPQSVTTTKEIGGLFGKLFREEQTTINCSSPYRPLADYD